MALEAVKKKDEKIKKNRVALQSFDGENTETRMTVVSGKRKHNANEQRTM